MLKQIIKDPYKLASLFILIIMIVFSAYTVVTAQSVSSYTFGRKTFTNLDNPLENLINKDKRNKAAPSGTYIFEFNDDMLFFWNDGNKFNFEIDSIATERYGQRIITTRYWLQNKQSIIKIVEDGSALIWTWPDNTDTIFTGKL